jgi:hypothetical protein
MATAVPQAVNEPQPSALVTEKKETTEDESDLYSINRFTV